MIELKKLALLGVLVLFLLYSTTTRAYHTEDIGDAKIVWHESCPVLSPLGTRCGEMLVPERRDVPVSRTIHVPIAVIPAPDQENKPEDPFLYLMGGTGFGFLVLDQLGPVAELLNRDVIVMEQRGNPMATPFFGCLSVPTQSWLRLIPGSVPLYGPGLVDKCKNEIAAKADLNSYMTPAAADDLIDLRKLLGIKRWNVFGISYGVRVATTLLRKDPEPIRSLVLDSGQITGGNFSGWDRMKELGEFFDRCTASPTCSELFPNLREPFERTVERLAANPAPITVAGKPEKLTAITFINLISFAIYNQGLNTVSRVPAAVMAADKRDYSLALSFRGFFAHRGPITRDYTANGWPSGKGSHNTQQVGMLCAEEYAYRPAEFGRELAQSWSETIQEEILGLQQLERQVCSEWSFDPEDPAQAQPPYGEAPTLIIHGEHDPVAPPEHGQIALDSLTNADMVTFKWSGHSILRTRTTCALPMVLSFVHDPTSSIDTSCADTIPEPAWVTKAPTIGDPDLAVIQAVAENDVSYGLAARGAYVVMPRVGLRGKVAAGFRDPEKTAPLTGDEVFRIASQTKVFTAAAILRLVEMGELEVDQPIAGLISPHFDEMLVENGYDTSEITLRHLLTHTSGLPDYAQDPNWQASKLNKPDHKSTRTEQIEWAVTRREPVGQPGERFDYGDTAYNLLGDIIERQTGLPQAPAYRSLLPLDELGLTNTWFETLEPPPENKPARAHQFIGEIDNIDLDPTYDLFGGGGQMSTLEDQANWITYLMTGRVFEKPETLELMMSIPETESGDPSNYGLGIVRHDINGTVCWGHSGFWGSSAYYCPDKAFAIASSRYKHDAIPEYNPLDIINAAILTIDLIENPASVSTTAE